MGCAKLLLEFDGEPLLLRAARTALEAGLDPIVAVLGAHADRVGAVLEGLPITCVMNDVWEEGLSSSIRVGVQAVEEQMFVAGTDGLDGPDGLDGLILMVTDQPYVTPSLLRDLQDRFEEVTASGLKDIVVLPAFEGHRGNPALFSISLLPRLKKLTGDSGARQLFRELPVIELPLADDSVFLDIDTPADYQQCRGYRFDPVATRREFPFFSQADSERVPIYLDTAATAQKPRIVIETMSQFLETQNANVHRGIYHLAENADRCFEAARATVARFLNAPTPSYIIFTHGATESLNLAAFGWARHNLKPGDKIVTSAAEHHSNLVPWQMLAEETGVELRLLPITERGAIDRGAYIESLEEKPKLVSLTGMSNVTGAILPLAEYSRLAHQAGARFAVDAAQLIAHRKVDVQVADVDFLSFSAHKLYGPTGVGVLYVKPELSEQMRPLFGGGGMVNRVTNTGFSVTDVPQCFEAGTPPIVEAIGLAAAIEWLESQDLDVIARYEDALYRKAAKLLCNLPGIRVMGYPRDSVDAESPDDEKSALLSFAIEGMHPHDVAQLLDSRGIAVRAGHHCAMLLHEAMRGTLGVPASVRVSMGLYTLEHELDSLSEALSEIVALRRHPVRR
jgi:cysteine desulfurase/selenocysteine lyase